MEKKTSLMGVASAADITGVADVTGAASVTLCNKTYRFKVKSQELQAEMLHFANLHCYEDRKTLKENFVKWTEDETISGLISREERALCEESYDLHKTKIHTKIFRSIKYYHIKNLLKNDSETETKAETSGRRKVKGKEGEHKEKKNILFSRKFIQAIKSYLEAQIGSADFKPSKSYQGFMNDHSELVQEELSRLGDKCDEETLMLKMKKTFKNQYFSTFKQV